MRLAAVVFVAALAFAGAGLAQQVADPTGDLTVA